jgi:hypothetical protein
MQKSFVALQKQALICMMQGRYYITDVNSSLMLSCGKNQQYPIFLHCIKKGINTPWAPNSCQGAYDLPADASA